MKTLIALFLTVAASSVSAAPEVDVAHTGVALDVAKTISVTDAYEGCGIVPVELVYDDSQGVRHIVTYSVFGGGCMGG